MRSTVLSIGFYAAPQHAALMREALLHATPQHVLTVCKALLDLESDLELDLDRSSTRDGVRNSAGRGT